MSDCEGIDLEQAELSITNELFAILRGLNTRPLEGYSHTHECQAAQPNPHLFVSNVWPLHINQPTLDNLDADGAWYWVGHERQIVLYIKGRKYLLGIDWHVPMAERVIIVQELLGKHDMLRYRRDAHLERACAFQKDSADNLAMAEALERQMLATNTN